MKIYIPLKSCAKIVLTYYYDDWVTNVADKIGGEWFLCGIELCCPLLHNPSIMYDPVKDTMSLHIKGSILQAIQLQKMIERNFKMREVDPNIHYFNSADEVIFANDDVYFRN